jgi:hypothetical protein
MNRQTDIQTDRQTGRLSNRETDIYTKYTIDRQKTQNVKPGGRGTDSIGGK